MAKRHNVFYQFLSAIDGNFREKISKHSIKKKHNGEMTEWVFSYNQRRTLLQISTEIKDFMRANYPEIRYIKDIKEFHLQAFLVGKSSSCSTESLKLKVSLINKLELICTKFYNVEINWRGNVYPPLSKKNNGQKMRDIAMSPDDFQKLLLHISDSKSLAKPAIEISYHYALRVSELSKLRVQDICFNINTISVLKSKGGRNRSLEITPNSINLLKSLVEGKRPQDKLIPIKPSSINKFLSRKLAEIGLHEKYNNSKIHSIRKLSAQEFFDNCRRTYDRQTSLQRTSVFLGHGKNRNDVSQIYIKNIY